MNDTFLNKTGLQYYHNRIKTEFASQTDLDTLEDKVDDIIAEGGEPNVIESISVNGTPQTITSKNVDLDIPTATSDLTNDGDGQSPFATEAYVGENGGKIQKIKVNGVEQTISQQDKSVDITVPTKVSDLTNDSGFITSTADNLTNYYKKTETYTQTEVDNLLAAMSTLDIEVVQELPSSNISKTTIYLVPKSTAGTNNTYDEYINTTGTSAGWEKIGDTEIDLSNYWNSTNLVAITTAEIDTIVAGS